MGTNQKQEWRLVWNEEFEGTSIDKSKWNYELGYIRNNELQCYTDRCENARIENSNLIIEGRKEEFEDFNYTSASLNTNGKFSFKYGKIEMRAKLPYGKGIWPAFWTLGANFNTIGWPYCGEIDIMEMVGGGRENDAKTYANLHWGENGGHMNVNGNMTIESGVFADDYHVIGIEWDDKQMSWYVDDKTYFTTAIDKEGMESFHKDHFILINLAIGGNWPGSPDETTVFPQRYDIDWIRVYEKNV